MASSSNKQLKPSLLMAAALLLLICTCATRGQAARPEPGSKNHMPQRAVSAAGVGVAGHGREKSGSAAAAAGVEMLQEEPEEMRECEDGDGREECLMRRTLVAHTDYIYTQGKHN